MSTLEEKAGEFSALLSSLSQEVNEKLKINAKNFEETLLVSLFPKATLNPAHNLFLPIELFNPSRNLAIVSRCPQRCADISLGDLTYNNDVSSEDVHEEDIVCQFSLDRKLQANVTSGHQEKSVNLKEYYCSKLVPDVLFQPCTEEEARFVVSLFSITSKSEVQLPDVLVFTKSTCEDDKEDKEQSNLFFCRCLDSSQIQMIHVRTLSDMVPIRHMLQPKDKRLSDSHAVAVYEFGPGYDDGEGAQITIELKWSSPVDLLSPPSSKASTDMDVMTTLGSSNSPVNFLFEELLDLSYFLHSKEEPSNDPDSTFPVDTFLSRYAKLARSSFEQYLSASGLDMTISNDAPEEQSPVSPRKLSDFLDFLWMSLRNIKHHHCLQKAVTAVITSILNREVHPYIPKSNTTKLARFIRQMLVEGHGEQHHLRLEAKELVDDQSVVETVSQLGIHKIAQDLRYVFITQDLLPKAELQCLNDVTSLNNTDAYAILACHYKALEVALSVKYYCNLSGNVLHPLTRRALTVLSSKSPLVRGESTPSFKVTFPPLSQGSKSWISFCAQLHPTIWKVGCWKNGSVEISNTFSSIPLLLGQSMQEGVNLDSSIGSRHFDTVYCYELNSVTVSV